MDVFAGNGTADQSDPAAAELVILRSDPTEEESTSDGHHSFLQDIRNLDTTNELSLAFQDGDLSMEVKARVLQMVMQCSPPSNDLTDGYPEEGNDVKGLVARLRNIHRRVQNCTFQERITLILLARKYQQLVTVARHQMEQERNIRKRLSKTGAVERKTRTVPTTTALNNLAKLQTGLEVEELKAYVQEGISLLYIGTKLGYYSLATFPGTAIRPLEFVLDFKTAKSCFGLLSKPINPIE